MKMAKMKWWQQISLKSIFGVSLGAMVGYPIYSLYDNLIVGQETSTVIAFSSALGIGVFGFSIFQVLKAWYKRKLQSIDIADELGINGTTPILIKRFLLLIQWAIPFAIVSLFLYGIESMQNLEVPSYQIFLDFVYWISGGVGGLIVHDTLRAYWRKVNAIEDHIKFEENVEMKKKKIIAKQKKRGNLR